MKIPDLDNIINEDEYKKCKELMYNYFHSYDPVDHYKLVYYLYGLNEDKSIRRITNKSMYDYIKSLSHNIFVDTDTVKDIIKTNNKFKRLALICGIDAFEIQNYRNYFLDPHSNILQIFQQDFSSIKLTDYARNKYITEFELLDKENFKKYIFICYNIKPTDNLFDLWLREQILCRLFV